MSIFNEYPYININDLNLDFILKAIREMRYEVTNFVSINAIKYADPIQWNITSQYEKNTIVIDPVTGTAYISVAPVPAGISLSRDDYWTVVFDLSVFITQGNKNITERVENAGVIYSTFALNAGDWVVWNGELYKALDNLPVGTAYSPNYNIERVTVEEYVKAILAAIDDAVNEINATIGNLDDLTTSDKTSVVNAINGVKQDATDVDTKIGDLADLNTTDKTSVVNAINELENVIANFKSGVYYNVLDYGVVGDGVTDDSAAINVLISTVSATGGTLFFPSTANGYYIASPIELVVGVQLLGESYTKLVGNGNNIIEVQPNGNDVRGYKIDNFYLVNNDNGGGILLDTTSERIWLCEMNNLKFEHCTHAIFDSGSQTYFCYNCRIRNVYAKNVNGSQIYFQMTRGFFFVEDVIVDYTYNTAACPWWGFDFSNLAGLTMKNVHVVGPAPSIVLSGYESNAGGIRITGVISGIGDSGKIYVDIVNALIDTGKGNTIAITNVDEVYLTQIQIYGCLGQGVLLTNCKQVVGDNFFLHGAKGLTGALTDCPGLNLNNCENVNISNITAEYNTGVGVASYQSENVIVTGVISHDNEIGLRSVSSTGVNAFMDALVYDNTTPYVLGSTDDHICNGIVAGTYTAHVTG